VELQGQRIRCYLDGKLIHDESARTPERFFVLAGQDEPSGQLILKAINAANEPVTAEINISGAQLSAEQARLTVLKAEHGSDNNSLDEPAKIKPVTTSIPIAGNQFTHEFPPYSLTVLRVAQANAGRSSNKQTSLKNQ